jgi:hypothetical protein
MYYYNKKLSTSSVNKNSFIRAFFVFRIVVALNIDFDDDYNDDGEITLAAAVEAAVAVAIALLRSSCDGGVELNTE